MVWARSAHRRPGPNTPWVPEMRTLGQPSSSRATSPSRHAAHGLSRTTFPDQGQGAPGAPARSMFVQHGLSPMKRRHPPIAGPLLWAVQRVPRRDCSRSMASKSALKLPLPKLWAPFALNDLEEHGWPVHHRLRKNLQQVPFVIAVNQDAELAQVAQGPRRFHPPDRAPFHSTCWALARIRCPAAAVPSRFR